MIMLDKYGIDKITWAKYVWACAHGAGRVLGPINSGPGSMACAQKSSIHLLENISACGSEEDSRDISLSASQSHSDG